MTDYTTTVVYRALNFVSPSPINRNQMCQLAVNRDRLSDDVAHRRLQSQLLISMTALRSQVDGKFPKRNQEKTPS